MIMVAYMKLLILLVFLSFGFAKSFRVDEILPSKNHYFMNMTLNYNNVQRKDIVFLPAAMPAGISGMPAATIPATQESNQDILSLGLGLRYGILKDLEIFFNLNGLYQHNKTFTPLLKELNTRNSFEFGALNLGLTYEIFKENEYPSLLLSADIYPVVRTVLGDAHKSFQYFKSYTFSLISFYTADPITFFLQTSFRLNLNKKDKDLNFNEGEVFTFAPLIYFSVSPYASLNLGVKYQFQTSDFLNQGIVAPLGSSLGYVFGASYEIKDAFSVIVDVELLERNSFSNKSVSLTLSYGF